MTLSEARARRLVVTPAQLAAIQALLPAEIKLAAFAIDGGTLTLGADLLLDDPGGPYAAAAAKLALLPVVVATVPSV